MTPEGRLESRLRRLDAVDLPTVLARAELLARRERKYLLPESALGQIVDALPDGVSVLEIDGARTFRYESVYFDTPDLLTYHEGARRREARFKIRTRAYLDSGTCMLEVKTRGTRGLGLKERIDHAIDDRCRLNDHGTAFIGGFPRSAGVAGRVSPTLITEYRRSTLLLAEGDRATIDVGLHFGEPGGRSHDAAHLAVVETKSLGHPNVIDRVLWAHGLRPVPMSKYCVGMALLHPDLPANHWNRSLRTHFGWQPERHDDRRTAAGDER